MAITNIILYSKYSKNSQKLNKIISENFDNKILSQIILICIDNKNIKEKVREHISIVPCLIKTNNNVISEKISGNNLIKYILKIIETENQKSFEILSCVLTDL